MSNLGPLPNEIHRLIFSWLPQRDLLTCRQLNKKVGDIATSFAFRHVALKARRNFKVFAKIARSTHLRRAVRELTIDSWVGPSFEYNLNGGYPMPQEFLAALSFVGMFSKVKTVNIRFNENVSNGQAYYNENEESYDFRFWVLDTVIQCLAGTWNGHLSEWEKSKGLKLTDDDVQLLQPVRVNTITVSNLQDFNDKRLTDSAAFKSIISSSNLRDLKLFITTERDEAAPDRNHFFPEQYDIDCLPHTWLSPSLAKNLRTLSLYCDDYWGWCPRLDLRTVNPGSGPDSGLPVLKVLALGNYVFSHEWQIDWIASLGRQNDSGGLEELYLDDCIIVFRAVMQGHLDTGATIIGTDSDGNSMEISNDKYPRKEQFITNGAEKDEWDDVTVEFDIRWHAIFSHWKNTMRGLNILKVGSGSWNGEHTDAIIDAEFWHQNANKDAEQLDIALSKYRRNRDKFLPELAAQVFLNFAAPGPNQKVIGAHEPQVRYKDGIGLDQVGQKFLRYYKYDMGMGPPWLEEDEEGEQQEDGGLWDMGTTEEDWNALLELLNTVEARRLELPLQGLRGRDLQSALRQNERLLVL
ncbi:F-box domain protein [Colletotrichum kahawae]|uniref:F-box domain protein n=1 Tax=Colletotrichum kahawae TaxID=34407 RepID=A0AAD9YL05_COLKA|nr:F-box domain protein [Colletotrichum kahawae]